MLRTSSAVQLIRLEAEKGNFAPLEEADNIHVLAGALKLFFRELSEPLIPWSTVEKLVPILHLPNDRAKVETMRGRAVSELFEILQYLEKPPNTVALSQFNLSIY